jgi:hypothetical protein
VKLIGRVRARYAVTADPLRSERRVEAVLLALGFALCLQLLYSGARLVFVSGPAAVLPAEDALRAAAADKLATITPAQSDEIRRRPLFWQNRRPLEKVASVAVSNEAPEEAGEIKGVKLVGVFGSGDSAGVIALVKGKKQRILQGDAVEGWTLESVEPDRAVLMTGDRRAELLLKQGKVAAVAQPQPIGKNGVAPVKGDGAGDSGQMGGTALNVSEPAPTQPAALRRLGGRTVSPVANGEQQAQ